MLRQPTPRPTMLHHLHELRLRLAYSVGVMLIGSGFGYLMRGGVIALLQRPLGQGLFYTSPMDSFNFIMSVCLLVGLIVALPVFCYHLIRFIEPALPRTLRSRTVLALIAGSYLLAVAGVAFAYLVSLPAALRFFSAVGTGSLHPLISIDQYFSFVLGYLATFAIVFQLPLLLLFTNHVTPLGPQSLSRWRKWVVVAAFVVALILPSAPDPLSQVVLALPIVALYEASIWLVRLVNRRRVVIPSMAATHAPGAPAVVSARSEPSAPTARRAPDRRATVIDLREHQFASQPKPLVNVLDLRRAG